MNNNPEDNGERGQVAEREATPRQRLIGSWLRFREVNNAWVMPGFDEVDQAVALVAVEPFEAVEDAAFCTAHMGIVPVPGEPCTSWQPDGERCVETSLWFGRLS